MAADRHQVSVLLKRRLQRFGIHGLYKNLDNPCYCIWNFSSITEDIKMKATLWFYKQGQSARDRGVPIQASRIWAVNCKLPYWAWISFANGFENL
jgi:hypothetical protein